MKFEKEKSALLLHEARFMVSMDKYLHAVQLYSKLIASEPLFSAAYLELARLYAKTGQSDAAAAVLRNAEILFPDDAEIVYQLGLYYLKAERFDRALTYLKKLAGNKRPHIHFNMGVVYYYKNDFKRAEAEFRTTFRLDPNYPRIDESIGELLIRRRSYTEAVRFLRRGIEKNPDSALNHHLLGVAYSKLYDWKSARKEFEAVIDIDPGHSLNWEMYGEVLMNLKRFDKAEYCFRKALGLSPRSVDILVNLGHVFSAKGEIELAVNYIKKALSVDPKNIEARAMHLKLKKAKNKNIGV